MAAALLIYNKPLEKSKVTCVAAMSLQPFFLLFLAHFSLSCGGNSDLEKYPGRLCEYISDSGCPSPDSVGIHMVENLPESNARSNPDCILNIWQPEKRLVYVYSTDRLPSSRLSAVDLWTFFAIR